MSHLRSGRVEWAGNLTVRLSAYNVRFLNPQTKQFNVTSSGALRSLVSFTATGDQQNNGVGGWRCEGANDSMMFSKGRVFDLKRLYLL